MDTKEKNLNLEPVVWHDESYEDKETGKRINPYPGVKHIVSTAHLPPGKTQEKIYYVVYRGPDGRQHQERVGRQYRDRMTAAKAAGIREAKIRGDEPPNRERREKLRAEKRAAQEAEDARWDFNRLFKAYMEAKGQYPRRVTDDGNFRAHLLAIVGSKTPEEVTSFDVDRIKAAMKKLRTVVLKSRREGGEERTVTKAPCSPGTVRVVLGLLTRLSAWGEKRGVKGLRFAVEMPRVGTVKVEQMTDEQMSAYLKAASECENRIIGAFLQFELLTGMRFGEVRNLRWDSIDLQRDVIHIRAPKGGRDEFVPLNPAAKSLLEQLLRDPENPFVFQGVVGKKGKKPSKRSGRIGISTVVRYGREFARAAGLPEGFRPNHGLRHSFASALASSGKIDLFTLQKLLTHKSPHMTQRYAHLRDEVLKRGADVMSKIVTAATTVKEKSGRA